MTKLAVPLLLLFLLLLGAGLSILDFGHAPSNPDIHIVQDDTPATPAPDFSFQTLNGDTITLADLKGKTILLNFWASWCAPCIAEFPSLIELSQTYKQDVVLVALSVDEDPANARRFLTKLKLPLDETNILIGLDPDKHISQDLFQTTAYPETYIIDRTLQIRRKVAGAIAWDNPDILQFLKDLNTGN